MDELIRRLEEKVMTGGQITKEEAMSLIDAPIKELSQAADRIRKNKCGNSFDMCSIINGKCGACSEDCKYCAQSIHYAAACSETYPLLDTGTMLKEAVCNANKGVLRFSIVTSGKRLSKAEIDKVCESIKAIKKEADIEVCVSFGLIDYEDFVKVKEAGASRVHCNLESSERYFKEVCTSHSYEEKKQTLLAAKRAGLDICSGGIIGLGESMEDRIDMVLTARELGVRSVPVNILNPIKGTPYENNKIISNEELMQVVAIFRFIIPDAMIRLAGGRGLIGDKGEGCFRGGANAAISGDMLTTAGITIDTDMKLVNALGYEVKK